MKSRFLFSRLCGAHEFVRPTKSAEQKLSNVNFSTNFTNYQKMSKKSIWALKIQKFQSSCPKRVKNARKKSDSTIFNFWANRVTHKVGQILRPANSADFVGHTICPKIKNRKIWFFPCVFHPSGQLLWNFRSFKAHIDFSDIFSIIRPKYLNFNNFQKNVQNIFAYSRGVGWRTYVWRLAFGVRRT